MKNWRINILLFLFFVVSSLIVFRLYYLQIKKGEYYQALALGQHILFEEVKGERGGIFFKKEKSSLAQTKTKNLIYVFPSKIQDKEEIIDFLADVLGEDKDDLTTSFQKEEILKREVSDEILEKLKNENIEGVYQDQIFARFYPQNNLTSHLTGFVNEEGEGQYGIEGYYNEVLKGKEGLKETERSPFGFLALFLDSKDKEEFKKGADIFLTIDHNIQYFSDKLLKEAKEEWDIDSGQIIVGDPLSGKILALATFPNFDPNQYYLEENFDNFVNSALQKLFEPGSVFKPIVMAAALNEDLITPETKHEDRGYVDLGGPPIYNFNKRVWREQTMTDVLEESINTGAVFVEQKLGKELFLRYLERFGFFEKTDIDLQGEVFSSNETLKDGYARDIAVASFGQGIAITPIQLVRAFSAIANGGKLMKPYLVEKMVQSDGKEVELSPQTQREVISQKAAAKLTSMLVSVVEKGSGRRAKIEGYFIAGKTGTAQVPQKGGYSEEETIQSFMGYFPAFNPKVIIFVKLDNPKYVETAEYSATILFNKLAKRIIDLWQIPPNY